MLAARLPLALNEGLLDFPLLIWGAGDGDLPDGVLAGLPGPVTVVQARQPDHDRLATRGIDVVRAPRGRFATALVVLPRSAAQARDRIARAAASTDGAVIVDGQKTDGVDSMLRALRGRGAVGPVIAKAHGKIFAVRDADVTDWLAPPSRNAEGFVTPPGSFSADGVDPASALLAAALPEGLSGRVVDAGAGWGYLSARVLARPGVTACHLVEADADALDAARVNVADPRAVFHWADATAFRPPQPADHVVMNPPFHRDRRADPDLGRAFIAAAAPMLAPRGQLWMVANRHLPYEADLGRAFGQVTELAGSASFKLYHAARPRGPARRVR
ncbi:ribosomal RNA small subunit methyltransferase C, putative [Oceaniovalibus guishaninsula JLT2003]|uniref:Ribosomal RNA small subunit methyltransferase C, putative n=1 Tax=Oceaniovalibus guishaninsula JLT2003 TaxID=1231392 RepID=K2I662_9RHOB|nr:methyltransferase [Oceaniovalibus guishaninsula]EKE44475.1 ribosomal RNA small subunit methyltransferase C, putative [Oceaniovalibus guishaninsula JLT2003]